MRAYARGRRKPSNGLGVFLSFVVGVIFIFAFMALYTSKAVAGQPMEQRQQTYVPPQKEITVVIEQPKEDRMILWIGMVIVPLVLGAGGWYFQHRRAVRKTQYK